jgi:hypothetical protein
MDDGTAYLATAVSYTRKMILKLATGSESQNFLFIHRHSKGLGLYSQHLILSVTYKWVQ